MMGHSEKSGVTYLEKSGGRRGHLEKSGERGGSAEVGNRVLRETGGRVLREFRGGISKPICQKEVLEETGGDYKKYWGYTRGYFEKSIGKSARGYLSNPGKGT